MKARLSLRPRKALLLQGRQDVELHHGDGAGVIAAVGDDDVGKLLGGLDEFVVHGLEHVAILVDEHLQRMATLGDVALQHTQETLVGPGIDKYLEVHQVAQTLVVEHHDALDDDDLARVDADGLLQTRAGDVRVGGLVDGPPLPQFGDLVGEQRPFEGVGVVEVGALTYLERQVRLVVIVGVEGNDRHRPFG